MIQDIAIVTMECK